MSYVNIIDALLDTSKMNLFYLGRPYVLADRFNPFYALNGEMMLLLMNWLDSHLVAPTFCLKQIRLMTDAGRYSPLKECRLGLPLHALLPDRTIQGMTEP